MKMPKPQFLKLQQSWYEKLAGSGFKDIEKMQGGEMVLIQTASYCYRNTDEFTRNIKEEYYRCLAQVVNAPETTFRNDVDRYVLLRHSEGAKAKTIVNELRGFGISRHRHSVRFIIRRYEMEWGLKHYNPQQLNKK